MLARNPLPAFDPARLADVVRGGAVAPAEFLAQFRRTVELDAGRLLEAASAGEPAQVSRIAHRIEGACGLIGAAGLASACSVLAAAAGSGSPGEIRTALDSFVEARRVLFASMSTPAPGLAGSGPPLLPAGVPSGQLCAGLVFLVVEDHDFQRAVIMRQLRQFGASEVHGFAGGADALQAARGPPPLAAILLLDLGMPSLDGIEVARMVGAEHLALSVILHSAQPEEVLGAQIERARSFGATVLGALGKPLTPAKLAPLIARHQALLAGEAPATPGSR